MHVIVDLFVLYCLKAGVFMFNLYICHKIECICPTVLCLQICIEMNIYNP
jgi:hypothetical protein